MAKQQIDFVRAAYRPSLRCDTCTWSPSTVLGEGRVTDLNAAKIHVRDHLYYNPDHEVIAEQVTVTTYSVREPAVTP